VDGERANLRRTSEVRRRWDRTASVGQVSIPALEFGSFI
jgi:hypothetical protein